MDILPAHGTPSQLGGIDLKGGELNGNEIGAAVGLETKRNGAYIGADGAGESGTCDIDHDDGNNGVAWVDCGSEEGGGFAGRRQALSSGAVGHDDSGGFWPARKWIQIGGVGTATQTRVCVDERVPPKLN